MTHTDRIETAPPVDKAHPADKGGAYRDLLQSAFTRDARAVRRTVPVAPLTWKRFARDRGLALDARPHELDVWDWVALFTLTRR